VPARVRPDRAARAVAFLDAARSGEGRLLVLTGEAGIGKTFLAERLADEATARGMTVAWSMARPGAPAFWPWAQLLRQLGVPDLFGSSRDAADVAARFALFDEVGTALTGRAAARPVLLVIDDLQQADVASLLLVQHLAVMLRGSPVLLVVTVRSDPDWTIDWADLVRAGEVIQVAPLRDSEIGALLDAATGASADRVVVQRILVRTGGNALFVRELIALAAAVGDATAVEGLPDTVRAVVAARVALRSPQCRRVLGVVAVLGSSSLRRVVQVFGEPSDSVADLLDEAARDQLLVVEDGDIVRFTHDIVRDAVYLNLPLAHRQNVHHEVAAVLERHDAPAAEIAAHLRSAGPAHAREAGRWWDAAGDERMAALAYEDAALCYQRALETPGWAGARQVRLGAARLAAGDAPGARAAYLAAVESARRSGDASLLAAAALGLGSGPAGFEVELQDREQIAALEDALRILPETERATRAMVLARLSVALTFTASQERRAELANAAVALALEAGDDAAVAAALASRCDVISAPDHVAERRRLTDRIIDIATRRHDSSMELVGRRMRIVARLEVGDMAGFAEDARAFDVVARALNQPLYLWYRPLWQAMTSLAEGRFAECSAALAEAVRIGTAAGSGNASILTSTLRWCLDVEVGDSTHLLVTKQTLDGIDAPWVSFTKALVAAQLGRIDEATTMLDVAMRDRDALPRDGNWLATVAQVAEVLGYVGAHPIAAWVYDQLEPYADLFVVEGIGAGLRGSVQRHLGLAAASMGRTDAAAAHFERAVEANRGLGAPLLVDKALADAQIRTATPPVTDARFAREGELWRLAYAGAEATVRDCKGLHDIARLIANPGVPIPAVDLAAESSRGTGQPNAESLHEPGDLGAVLDEQTRRAYRRRLAQLEDEAAEADTAGDAERSARIEMERDALVAQLSAAYGLGGRPRRAGSPVERARTTVTARIRDAIRRVDTVHPELGRHLRLAVNTGTLCSYEPETKIHWLTS
jgi:tetratricopeptide (TPR) repeat protein